MQKVSEIANHIKEKKYLFEVVVPGKYKGTKTSIEQANTIHGSVEGYIENIIKSNNSETAIINLFSSNGSSYKSRGNFLISLQETKPVATNTQNATNVATSATNVATTNGLGNLNESKMLSVSEKIELEVLKVKHEMVSSDRDTLKSRVKELERKVDELQDEKLKLVKENGTAEERHKLNLERELLAIEKESKSGALGFIEEINQNPELIKAVVGFLKPDHPMLKDSGMGNAQIQEAVYHTDADANNVLKELPKLFQNVGPEQVIKFYTVAMAFVKEPEKIEPIFKQIYPNL